MDTKAETELLETVVGKARQMGLDINIQAREPALEDRRADALVCVGRGRHARTYTAEVKRGLRPATLGAVLHQLKAIDRPLLLIADYVTPPLAEKLKARGVAFLDAAGNAFVDQPPLYLWVKGEKPPDWPVAREGTGRAFRASGLKVLFALLCHPEWVDQPYRKLAELAGVAHGTVGWVMAELARLGYVTKVDGARRLVQAHLLLKRWAEAYVRTLRPKLALGRYRAEHDRWWIELKPGNYGVLLGGEPAAARMTKYLRPETVTLYAARLEPRLLLDYKLRQDMDGGIEFVKRFWVFESGDDDVVPLPLVYADLLVAADARCLEAAELIYKEIVDGFER